MTFSEQLNIYIDELGVSRREVSTCSGLSPATLTRYCSGERTPANGSPQLYKLAAGLHSIAVRTDADLPDEDAIIDALEDTLKGYPVPDYDVFLVNLKRLLGYLNIRNGELARGIYTDSSYISKVLSGSRRPRNPGEFINTIAAYITARLEAGGDLSSTAKLLDVSEDSIRSSAELNEQLLKWFGSPVAEETPGPIPRFLSAMDGFDLNEYMRSIRFDDLKTPPSVPHMPTRKEYTGIERMKESELDFMKTTVMSKSMEPCTLYSDMPLEEMAADPIFTRKYLFGLAMMLKKGLHLNFIHDVNRPFDEMILGLENYIPMYMTGQISPYYLPAGQSNVFMHLLKVSGAAALEGCAIKGDQASGRYVLYRSTNDLKHYKKRADDLLDKAQPLMEIYRQENSSGFTAFINNLRFREDIRMVCGNLPLYFMSKEMLGTVLSRVDVPDGRREAVMKYYSDLSASMLKLTNTKKIHLTIPGVDRSHFEESPISPALADLFIEKSSPLSFEEYEEYIDNLKRLSDEHPNLTFELDPSPAFRNINYYVIGDRMVIVSKEKSPAIHFVIHHGKMVRAFRNFVPHASER